MNTSGSKKNKQHYVWRFYLEAWADQNDLIFCYRKGKIFKPNIKDVAQQRNFYKLKELTAGDILLIKSFISKSPKHLQKTHLLILNIFIAPHKTKSFIESTGGGTGFITESLEVLINNMEEDLHAGIESSSTVYIESIRAEDVKFWENRQSRFSFLNYVALQLLRTKGVQDLLAQAIDINQPDDRRLENALGVLRHIFALNVAHSLCEDPSYTIILLLNDSPVSFITSDQPVINTHSINTELLDAPTKFEIYYPVSPRKAVIITMNPEQFKSDTIFVTSEDVDRYNYFVIDRSHEQIFANSESQLSELTFSLSR